MKKTIIILFLAIVAVTKVSAQTGDPWITKVYNDTWGRNPTALEYNIHNYNDGHWNNYGELMKYIYEYQKNLNSWGISFKYSQKLVNNRVVVGIFQNGTQIAADLITNDGGSIVAQGGGNIISTNGGGIVGNSGGTIVAQGGGNIAILPGTKGASFGSSYTLAGSGTTVVKTSGSGAIIIR
jgi:hypothetical protein